MKSDLANLSADLRRMSYWIISDREKLVRSVLLKLKDKYNLSGRVGVYADVWKEIQKLLNKESKFKKADRATTLSSIFFQESLK